VIDWEPKVAYTQKESEAL